MAGKFQPLDQNFAIVKANGLPTEYFIRWAQQRQIDITTAVTFGDLANIHVIAGVGLTGGGSIDADVTVDLEDTAVVVGTYGDATHSAQITIDQQGRITNAVDVAISGGGGGSSGEASLTPPALAAYTWINQGSASAVDNGNGISMTVPNPGSTQIRALAKVMAAGDFDVKIRIKGITNGAVTPTFGLFLQNNASGKILLLGYEPAGNTLYFQRWSGVTAFNSAVASRAIVPAFNWFRATRVGTTIEFFFSLDGLDWKSMGTELEATYTGTIDRVGFSANVNNTSTANFVVQSVTGL